MYKLYLCADFLKPIYYFVMKWQRAIVLKNNYKPGKC